MYYNGNGIPLTVVYIVLFRPPKATTKRIPGVIVSFTPTRVYVRRKSDNQERSQKILRDPAQLILLDLILPKNKDGHYNEYPRKKYSFKSWRQCSKSTLQRSPLFIRTEWKPSTPTPVPHLLDYSFLQVNYSLCLLIYLSILLLKHLFLIALIAPQLKHYRLL